jgi:hypothetical protein
LILALIFNFFSTLPQTSLSFLFELLLERLNLPFEIDFYLLDSNSFLIFLCSFPINFWLGFLNNVKLIFSKLGMFVKGFVKKIIVLNLALLKIVNAFKRIVGKEEKEKIK